jgi:rhodanese-related sulfurtransferase
MTGCHSLDRTHQLQIDPTINQQPPNLSRRAVVALFVGGGAAAGVYAFADTATSISISPDAALAGLAAGQLIMVDIRRPDEWALTGLATGAIAADMRDADFIERLDRLVAGDRAAPIALICARGVRSRRLAAKLTAMGFSGVLDVSEGMLGSASGPGWIARKLPISAF